MTASMHNDDVDFRTSNSTLGLGYSGFRDANVSTKVKIPELNLDLTYREPCQLVDFLLSGVLLGLVCVLGLVGNTLSTFTLWPKRNYGATSFILINLAMFDSGLLLTLFVISTVASTGEYFAPESDYIKYDSVYVFEYVSAFGSIFHMAATLTIVLVTFHRYIAACHPLKVTKWGSIYAAKVQIFAIALGSLIFNIPRFLDDYATLAPDGSKAIIVYSELGSNPIFDLIYTISLYYLIIFIVPFIGLIYMTVRLLKNTRSSRKRREEMTRAKRDEDDLTMTLVSVVVIFLFCQIINPIRRAMKAIVPASQQGCGSATALVTSLSRVAIAFNSSVNFILYCLFGRRFRKLFIQRVWRRGQVATEQSVTAPGTTN